MLTLVLGGSASGKSEYAEELLSVIKAPRIYIATMQPYDQECMLRIEKHRLQRAEKGFSTLERYVDLADLPIPDGCGVLLECMGNLVANECFSPQGQDGDPALRVLRGIRHLHEWAHDLVIVSNDVFADGSRYAAETVAYLEALARVNCEVARMADRVVEVVCGIPVLQKGEAL